MLGLTGSGVSFTAVWCGLLPMFEGRLVPFPAVTLECSADFVDITSLPPIVAEDGVSLPFKRDTHELLSDAVPKRKVTKRICSFAECIGVLEQQNRQTDGGTLSQS